METKEKDMMRKVDKGNDDDKFKGKVFYFGLLRAKAILKMFVCKIVAHATFSYLPLSMFRA